MTVAEAKLQCLREARNHLYAVSFLALLPVLGAVDDMTGISKASMRVACEIRSTRTNAGTQLVAVISASGAVAGSYSFRVDRAGSSKPIVESGEFEIGSTAPAGVKKARVDLAAGEAYSAALSIEWPGGMSSCTASGK